VAIHAFIAERTFPYITSISHVAMYSLLQKLAEFIFFAWNSFALEANDCDVGLREFKIVTILAEFTKITATREIIHVTRAPRVDLYHVSLNLA
jgi:hypothetical protein